MHDWHWRMYRDITGISARPVNTTPVLQVLGHTRFSQRGLQVYGSTGSLYQGS